MDGFAQTNIDMNEFNKILKNNSIIKLQKTLVIFFY